MLSTVGGTPGAPGLRRLASLRLARRPTVLADAVLAEAMFTIATHLLLCALRWPGQVRRFPHLTRPALVHLFEPKFGRMSSRFSMSVRRYRPGLTFCGAAPGPAFQTGPDTLAQRVCLPARHFQTCIFVACQPHPAPATRARAGRRAAGADEGSRQAGAQGGAPAAQAPNTMRVAAAPDEVPVTKARDAMRVVPARGATVAVSARGATVAVAVSARGATVAVSVQDGMGVRRGREGPGAGWDRVRMGLARGRGRPASTGRPGG